MNILYAGLAILAISIFGGLFFVKRNPALDQGQTKAAGFVLYFWIISFIQLGIAALIYHFAKQ